MRDLVHNVLEGEVVGYNGMSGLAFLTWDIIIMMSDEVEYIWRRKWSPAKLVYILSRYVPWVLSIWSFVYNADEYHGCESRMGLQMAVLEVTVFLVDLILLMRLYVLYNRHRVIMGVLALLFAAETVALCIIMAEVTPHVTYSTACSVIRIPFLFLVYWIILFIFQTLLFGLTLVKFFQSSTTAYGRQPILEKFVKDGTWAFALTSVTMLVNVLLYRLIPYPLGGVGFTWLIPVMSFAGSRLILNARRLVAAFSDGPESENMELEGISFNTTDSTAVASPATENKSKDFSHDTPVLADCPNSWEAVRSELRSLH